MKKLSILATSLAAIILLTACPNKPDDGPQPLQLSDVVGDYDGTLTVDAVKVGDSAAEQYVYSAWASPYPSEETRGLILPGYMVLSYTNELFVGSTIFWYGEFGGKVSRAEATYRTNYELSTPWGKVPVVFSTREDRNYAWVHGDVPVEFNGSDIAMTYADTVRDFVDVDGETCTIILRHTFRATRVR